MLFTYGEREHCALMRSPTASSESIEAPGIHADLDHEMAFAKVRHEVRDKEETGKRDDGHERRRPDHDLRCPPTTSTARRCPR